MKFSWLSLNYFINLDHITINELTEILTIKGFEIDNIDNYKNINDYIFDIAITANRQDTLSVIGLAHELSYILNQNIKNQYPILQYKPKYTNIINQKYIKYLSQLKINKIIELKNNLSPLWLINYLKIHNIASNNLILDIKQYIKIKWGHDIHFFCLKDIQNSQNYIKIQKTNLYEIIQYNKNQLIKICENQTHVNQDLIYQEYSSSLIACSYIYSKRYVNKINNTYNTIDNMQGYYEALQLIATFGKACISKAYSYNHTETPTINHLNIHKNLIKYTLGPTNNNKSKYLGNNTIYHILEQLKLKPQYNYYDKNFKITIPRYRLNDLSRKIDIIEEIGRIYGYQNFTSKLPYINKKGYLSKQYQTIKYFRQYFRDLGIHEMINSSLHKYKTFPSIINIHNPILNDQSSLRQNLLDDIINNKIYNYKQKNNNIEVFEIGKVFTQNIQKNIHEEHIHLAGILSNTNFTKISWTTKPSELNWFHAKGILEQFFEKVQIAINWHTIDQMNTIELQSLSLSNFDIKNTIYIRNAIDKQIIGVLGLINPEISEKNGLYETINIFEFNINKLINSYNKKSHLRYIFQKYSTYPSVIRDISIKINKNISINTVKQFIYNLNKEFIQNVEVFNQYKDIQNINQKCIGIRITYNAINKTLNQQDLQIIEQNINFILKTYQST